MSSKIIRKLIRGGVPLSMLFWALVAFNVAFANDGELKVTTTAISNAATLAQSAQISYTLINTGSHAMYYSAVLDPSPGRCSMGLETPEGIIWNGESKIVAGVIEARCYQQPGTYKHTLRIKQHDGPNDRDFTGEIQFTIPVTITVQPNLQNFLWAASMETTPLVVGKDDPFTTTITVENLQQKSGIFESRVRFYYEPTDGSIDPSISGDGTLAFNGKVDWMELTWTDDIAPNETVTMTITSRGGPFTGAYPGSIVAKLPSGQEVAQGLIVLKSKPQITAVEPTLPIPGDRIRLVGRNLLSDVPSGTSAHNLFLIIQDPVTNGVSNIYGDSEGMIWEDESISFVLPKNLKAEYCYTMRVYRAFMHAVSEPFQLCTGQKQAPALSFGMDVAPAANVVSGGLITASLTISNMSAITQSSLTTFTLGGGAILEVVGYQGPGDVFGLGGVNDVGGLSMTDMRWFVDVPPKNTVTLAILMVANEVTSQTSFPGFITWQIPEDVYIGSIVIEPSEHAVKLNITSGPTTVDLNAQTCVNGDFSSNDGSGKVLLTYVPQGRMLLETIVLTPTSWGASEICFSLQGLFAGKYDLRLRLADKLSQLWSFIIIDSTDQGGLSLYLPLVTR